MRLNCSLWQPTDDYISPRSLSYLPSLCPANPSSIQPASQPARTTATTTKRLGPMQQDEIFQPDTDIIRDRPPLLDQFVNFTN